MSWSTEQTHQIVEQFWQNGVVRCPDDNGPLKLKLRKLHAGDYELQAECLVCGRRDHLRRGDDPRRPSFRPWTGQELELVSQGVTERGQGVCPVCSSPVKETPASVLQPVDVVLRCFRCGNSNQWVWTNTPNSPTQNASS